MSYCYERCQATEVNATFLGELVGHSYDEGQALETKDMTKCPCLQCHPENRE